MGTSSATSCCRGLLQVAVLYMLVHIGFINDIIFAMLIHLFVSFSFSVVTQCYSHYSLIPRSSPCPGEKQEQPGAPDQTT